MKLQTMGTVRKHMTRRLEPLFIRLRYKGSAKVYISSIGTVYEVYYEKLNSYDNLKVFVMLNEGEMVLCSLQLRPHHTLTYEATELPIAFSRCSTRSLQVDKCQIIGYLLPCSEK
jgi:hypothetical protein